jgi:putative ABC transport system permease protein
MTLLWENIVLAINSLLSNKMRALLTMLGIIIGIGSVIAIVTVGDSLAISISQSMQSMGANDVYVVVQNKDTEEETSSIDGIVYGTFENDYELTEDDCISEELVKELCERFKDEIYAINLELGLGTGTVKKENNTADVSVLGTTVGYYVTNEINIIKGSMFSQKDFEEKRKVTIVSDKLVDKIFDGDLDKAIGSEIEVTIDGKTETYAIVGIYEYEEQYIMGMSMGTGDDVSTNMYLPLKTAFDFYNTTSYVYSYFQIITNVDVDADTLASEITNFFEPYYRNNRNFEVTAITLGSMISMVTSMLSTVTLAISIVAGIALLVGGIGVMNIMLVSITERTKEIGTRKALGATNSSIRTQFIVEAVIICLIGGIFGIILGITLGVIASNVLGYPASPSVSSIIVSLVFSMSIGVFFGYYPANKAAKMNPIDALRYE